MPRQKIIPVVLLTIVLSSCSSTNSETPFFVGSGENVSSQSSQSATPTPSGKSDKKEKDSPSKEKDEDKQNKDSSSDKPKQSKKDKEIAKKYPEDKAYADKNGLKLNEKGEFVTVEIITPEAKSDEQFEKEKRTGNYDKSDDLTKVKSGDLKSATSIANAFQKGIKDKDWGKACSQVLLEDWSKGECESFLKKTSGGDAKYKTMTPKNTIATMSDKDYMAIALKDKFYEESQRQSFFREKGNWKLILQHN